MADKDLIHRLQVIFGCQVHDGEIFVIELFMLIDRVPVAFYEIDEKFLVSIHMAVEVHRHEPRQLQETGIDKASMACARPRHGGNHRVAEPVCAALYGEDIYRGWIDPRVNWAALEDQAARNVRIP